MLCISFKESLLTTIGLFVTTIILLILPMLLGPASEYTFLFQIIACMTCLVGTLSFLITIIALVEDLKDMIFYGKIRRKFFKQYDVKKVASYIDYIDDATNSGNNYYYPGKSWVHIGEYTVNLKKPDYLMPFIYALREKSIPVQEYIPETSEDL